MCVSIKFPIQEKEKNLKRKVFALFSCCHMFCLIPQSWVFEQACHHTTFICFCVAYSFSWPYSISE